MQKSSKYEYGLFLFWALVILLPTAKMAIAEDAGSRPDARAAEEIPTGFKLDRYAGLWARNPFTLVAPTVPQIKHSAFDKLFLTSWLKDSGKDAAFIQDSETNEVQKITAEPNKDNLRLIALHLSPSPQLVEALISDGKEIRPVKFRLEVQLPTVQAVPPVAQVTDRGVTARMSNLAQAASAPLLQPRMNPTNVGTPGLPATSPVGQPLTRSGGSGASGSQTRGGQRPGPRGESEGMHLPRPGQTAG
jgi:hypothetical protein